MFFRQKCGDSNKLGLWWVSVRSPIATFWAGNPKTGSSGTVMGIPGESAQCIIQQQGEAITGRGQSLIDEGHRLAEIGI